MQCKKTLILISRSRLIIIFKGMIPFPFSISLIFLSLAFLTSKLQYHSTYLTIALYSVLGPIETGAITLSAITFLSHRSDQTIMILFIASLSIIFILNLIGYIIQSCYLLQDRRFRRWANRRSKDSESRTNLIWFHIIAFLAFITNYKLKMVYFSRLFNFQCFKFQFTSLDKFKAFNILSFVGYIPQILILYCSIMSLLYIKLSQEETYAFIDCLIIIILNMVFSIAIINKQNDFFVQELDGLPMNQTVSIIEEMNSATAILQQRVRQKKKMVMNNRSLEDISEFEQFAYTSTKRERNMKQTGNAQKNEKEESCYFEDNSEVNTGSRIHSEVSQRQEDQAVEAVVANCGEEELQAKNQFRNILQVDQYFEEESEHMSSKEKENIVSRMICSDQPLNYPEQDITLSKPKEKEQDHIITTDVSTQLMKHQQDAKIDNADKVHISSSRNEGNLQIIDQIIASDEQSSKRHENFKFLINESALIQSEQSILRQVVTPHKQYILENELAQAAKISVKRVVSAHHSPNRRIRKEGDIYSKAEIRNIGQVHINEDHDEKPIKNKSVEKLKKYENPLNSGHLRHPLYGQVHHTQENKEENDEVDRSDLIKRRHQIFRKRGKGENRFNRIQTDIHSNIQGNFVQEKQQNPKQFKRSKPQNCSLVQFSTKNNTIDNVLYESDLTQGKTIRKPTQRIQVKYDEMTESPSEVLSRNERQRFSDKRERPLTSNSINRRGKFSLERKTNSAIGKKMKSLEKIYLQKQRQF